MNFQRILELDALRGLAALAVIFYHYFFRYNQIYGHENLHVDWADVGRAGVQLFFMVSGFVIFWTLNRTERPLDFLVSRFSRLYPAYWLAIFVTFSIVYVCGLPGREASLSEALANTLMFHEYFGVPHVDGVYWTLTVELTFYFWIFLIYLSSNLNRIEEIFSVLIFVSMLHSLGLISIPTTLYKFFILRHIPLFLGGICFYKLFNNDYNKKTVITLALSLFSTIVIYSFKPFILFTGFYLLFFMVVSGRLKILTFKPLVFLGSISYSLYLLHQNIGYVIINKSYELQLHPLIGIFSAIAILIVFSTVFMKYIENPALSFIRGAYKRSTG